MKKGGYRTRVDRDRDPGRFVGLPHAMLKSKHFMNLSFAARSLLLELALQYNGGNNGRLIATKKHLARRGWGSQTTVTRALAELIAARMVLKTVQGGRPHRANWYALTCFRLYPDPKFDFDSYGSFRLGAYRDGL